MAKTPEAYSYDLDGNLTGAGRWTFTWDAENRLVRLVAATATVLDPVYWNISKHRLSRCYHRLRNHSDFNMVKLKTDLTGTTFCCVVMVMLLVLTTGCCYQRTSNTGLLRPERKQTPGEVRGNELMSIWRSPKATPQERAEALNKWLSPETSLESAISLLGPEGILSRAHGPSTVLIQDEHEVIARKNGLYEKLWLEYNTPNGSVALSFHSQEGVSTEWRFERAYAPGQTTTSRTNWVQ